MKTRRMDENENENVDRMQLKWRESGLKVERCEGEEREKSNRRLVFFEAPFFTLPLVIKTKKSTASQQEEPHGHTDSHGHVANDPPMRIEQTTASASSSLSSSLCLSLSLTNGSSANM
jgi:hypothetical protein